MVTGLPLLYARPRYFLVANFAAKKLLGYKPAIISRLSFGCRGSGITGEVAMSETATKYLRHGPAASGGRPRANSGSGPDQTTAPKMPPRRTWIWFLVVLLGNFMLVRLLVPSAKSPVTVPY